MCTFVKYGLIALLLALGAAILAGCPAKKELAGSANTGMTPGGKIATPPPAPAPVAPPVATSAHDLAISEFTVTGMKSNEDSAAIEGKLIKLPGVTTVSADFKAGTAKVQYDPSKCTPAEMVKAVEGLGFKAVEKQTSVSKLPPPGQPQPADNKAAPDQGAKPGAGA